MYIKCIILSLSLYLSMIASLSLSFWLVGGPTWATSFRFWWNVSLSGWSGEEKVTSRIEGWNNHGMLVIRQSQQCYCDIIFLFSKLFFLFLSNFGRIELRSYLNFSCLLFAFQIKHACWYCSCKFFWFFKLLIIFYQAPLCKCILLWLCCAFNQAALCLLMSGSNASSLCVWTEELHQGPTIWLPPTYMQTKQQNLENITLRILESIRIFLTTWRAHHMTQNNIYANKATECGKYQISPS